MRTFGLIGYPLSHSFSQTYFIEKFKRENIPDCEFKNFPIQDINELHALIKNNPALCGLSITIPHKQSVVKFLDKVDEVAKKIGSVNCIKRWQMADGRWQMIGYNTDVWGFEESFKHLLKPHHNKALVFGTGGAAKAIAYVLDRSKIKFRFILRNKNNVLPSTNFLSYTDINQKIIQEYSLIINATPLGMFPDSNDCPNIPYRFLTSKHLLYDLIYNPSETLFLKKGKEKGAQIKNGLEMLNLQAEKAWEIWNT